LTPDLEDERDTPQVTSPTAEAPATGMATQAPEPPRPSTTARPTRATASQLTATEKFRRSVRKVIAMHRTSGAIARRGAGAEPGIDPRRSSAVLQYGHIRQQCVIELCDYSSVRQSFGRMTNNEFVRLMQDPVANKRESWVKVRWINIGGISWDVISALALRHGVFTGSYALNLPLTRPQTCTPWRSRMYYTSRAVAFSRR
jgi:hypothetical protein